MKPEKMIFAPEETPLSVGLLVMDSANMLSLAAAIDPMRVANRRGGARLYEWHFLTPGEAPVTLTSGLVVAAAPLAGAAPPDLLVVVAGFRIEEQLRPGLLARLRALAPKVRAFAGVDGGSWFLAAAGLLDGRTATTHWEDLETFALRFPAVNVVSDRYVISGPMITTGGAGPCIDMMLHLVRTRQGAEFSLQVGGALLYDPVHAPQVPQSRLPLARLGQVNPPVARAVALMQAGLEEAPPISEIARHVGLTPRSLEVRFRAALGRSPGAFFLGLRLAEAHRLGRETALPVQDIALRTGFASQSSLARAFRRQFGASISEVRQGREERPRP